MKKRIFVVEDEPDMVKIATDLLEEEGYVVSSSTHPDDALRRIIHNPPDIVLLDLRLPDKDGFQVCRELKTHPKTKHVPVIMVSVKSDESDVVVGLEIGAEDYISKPYRRRELVARVKNILRRKDPEMDKEKITLGQLSIDLAGYVTTIKGKKINLTPKEFELLLFFVRKNGRVVTRASISECVWGIEFTGSTRTIDVHVDQLRKKLGRLGKSITGLKGVGYRFEMDIN